MANCNVSATVVESDKIYSKLAISYNDRHFVSGINGPKTATEVVIEHSI